MDQNCVFCRIVAGELPVTMEYDSEEVVAFRDTAPQAPVHLLVIPRLHLSSASDPQLSPAVWNALLGAVQTLGRREDMRGGFRLVINSGADAGQSVAHLHVHMLAGRSLAWPPG